MMRFGGVVVSLVAFLTSSAAYAQCTKDTDCKGDRVCDAGACTSPAADANGWGIAPVPPAGAEAARGSEATAPSAAPAAANAPGSGAAAPPPATPVVTPTAPAPAPPKMKRHSTGMMAGGIVMVSVAPIVLLSALALSVERWSCRSSYLEPAYDEYDDYNYYERDCGDNTASVVLTLAGVGLLGAGIPLIVIGAKKEPVTADPQATISPWATPDGAGLRLRLTL